MNPTARAWVELVRGPAALTVPGDLLAGAAAAGGATVRHTGPVIGASLCLYWAGMALNDWADRDIDAAERPGRPIPSGRVRPGAALAAATALTGAGLGLAAATGSRRTLSTAAALTAAVWGYDLWLKNTPAGPAAMASARGLNLLLGAAATGRPMGPAARPAALLAAHTLALTSISRHEVHGGPRTTPATALLTTAAIAGTTARPRRTGSPWPGRVATLAAAGAARPTAGWRARAAALATVAAARAADHAAEDVPPTRPAAAATGHGAAPGRRRWGSAFAALTAARAVAGARAPVGGRPGAGPSGVRSPQAGPRGRLAALGLVTAARATGLSRPDGSAPGSSAGTSSGTGAADSSGAGSGASAASAAAEAALAAGAGWVAVREAARQRPAEPVAPATRAALAASVGVYLATVVPPLVRAVREPTGARMRAGVVGGLQGLLPLQATLAARAGAPRLAPPALLLALVAARRLSRKVTPT
ncbi:SCO3242 family prenyltransferase [Streptomyces sp. B6B3]|uniref:SCO3242 family prenyltransferase n=1 Tax=Streptomyces sp. B6B3 TaxID=3153570 RepID=UPI00325F394E